MVPNIVKGANKKAVGWMYFVIYAVIIVIIIAVVVAAFKAIKQGGKDIGNIASNNVIAAQTGKDATRIQEIRNIAENRYKNWGKSDYSTFWVNDWDEDGFISDINRMQDLKELQLYCQFYVEAGGIRIADVIKTAFDKDDIKQLKQGYYSAILSF